MNDSQQVFNVFFAIFWGATFNVQPKWKPFPFPVLADVWQAWCRLGLSIVFLNLAPIAFFGWTFWLLQFAQVDAKNLELSTIIALLASAVLPAYANFGFYRLWVGIVEWKPTWFYRMNEVFQPKVPVESDPTVESLKLHYATSKTCLLHFIFAIFYLAVAFVAPWVSISWQLGSE